MNGVIVPSLILCLSFGFYGVVRTAPIEPQTSDTKPLPAESGRATPTTAIGLRPEAVNVFVQTDARLFILMAALNIAGYEDQTRGSPNWPQWRQRLVNLDPDLRARLAAFYTQQLGPGSDAAFRLGGYLGLSLTLSPPPALALPARRQTLPGDVVAAARFLPLVREFYAKSGIAKLVSPALDSSKDQLDALRQQTGVVMLQTLNYLHTIPILRLARRSASPRESEATLSQPRFRLRRLFVVLNPLDASDTAYIRNDILNGMDVETDRLPGDDYFLVTGSSFTTDPIRLAFLQFVLEPLSERYAQTIHEQAPVIGQLAERVMGPKAAQKETAFSIVNKSLVRAVEARLKRLRAQEVLEGKLAADKPVTEKQAAEKLAEEEILAELSTHYEQGAVLVFHFYDRLIRGEQVGADIADYYESLLASIDVEREAARAEGYRDVRARVEARRAAQPKGVVPSVSPLVEKLGQAETFIRAGKFEPAQGVLSELAKQYPNNARVLYGQAQVINRMASLIDPSKSADEDAAWEQLMTQLEEAVRLYRRALSQASPQEEKWLISQAHVAIGKILDFSNQPEAAAVEYQKAIELGDVPGGAYAQAKEQLETKD